MLRSETEIPRENRRQASSGWLCNDFLGMTPKAQGTKAKNRQMWC